MSHTNIRPSLFILLGLLLVILGGGIWFMTHKPLQTVNRFAGYGDRGSRSSNQVPGNQEVRSQSTETVGVGETTTLETYSIADVAMHASKESCWTAVDGSVYDLTLFISQHPGGESNIMKICGIDGTEAFSAQHGRNRGANEELASLKIGTLAQ